MVVIVTVTMVMVEVVIVGLHLYFVVAGRGKERGLYPPSDWCQRTEAIGDSFSLDPGNHGFVASFWLELENSRSCSFVQVGSYKSRGWCLLTIGVGELGSWCF